MKLSTEKPMQYLKMCIYITVDIKMSDFSLQYQRKYNQGSKFGFFLSNRKINIVSLSLLRLVCFPGAKFTKIFFKMRGEN
jgi:hypothetical protein